MSKPPADRRPPIPSRRTTLAVAPAPDPTADTPDPGLFGPDSVTWRIHGDPAMVVGGFRALLIQAVHPLVMAGFDANSTFRDDPWGRLQRTGDWVNTVTFGTTPEARRAGARLRRIHGLLAPGIEPESGLPYRIDDPDLLLWVHCTEVESFVSTYQRCGGTLRPGDADRYAEEMVASAELVGLDPARVPRTMAQIDAYYDRVLPDLRVSAVARRNTLWSLAPPMPTWVALATPARPAWASLMLLALAMLPRWARRLYGLPALPTTDVAASLAGTVLRRTLATAPGSWLESPAQRSAKTRLSA